MAYMTKDGNGPYPCYAGEHCGNHLIGSMAYAREGQTHVEANYYEVMWLAQMRWGRPRPTKEGATEELENKGWVGLYLKEDDKRRLPGEVEIDTPDKLKEPSADERTDR